MANERGQAYALTVLARVVREREEPLREALAALGDGPGRSPLRVLPGTHFARFAIVPELLGSTYLVFSSTFDGARDPYLAAMRELVPELLDSVFGHCDRWPGCADREEYERWMRQHQLDTATFTGAYPDAPLSEVLEALDLRERLRAFAPRAQGMSDRELQAEFLAEFGA